jgi:hypothetical protein
MAMQNSKLKIGFPKFSDVQLNRISEILGNLGIALLISMVIPGFITQPPDILLSLIGFILAIACWVLSVILLKKEER